MGNTRTWTMIHKIGLPVEGSSEQKRILLAELLQESPENGSLYALSLAQQRLWFLEKLEPGTAVYNIPMGLRLRGPLNTRALNCAVSEVIRRHETLRTSFVEANGEVFQRVARTSQIDIPTIDLR